jgi:hypothetical protein
MPGIPAVQVRVIDAPLSRSKAVPLMKGIVALTRTPCSADDDFRALGREELGGDAADAGTRAGDESDLFARQLV